MHLSNLQKKLRSATPGNKLATKKKISISYKEILALVTKAKLKVITN